MRCAAMQCSSYKVRRKNTGLASIDILAFHRLPALRIVWPRLWCHGLDKLPKVYNTTAGVVAEAQRAAR